MWAPGIILLGFAGAGARLIYGEYNGQVMGLGSWGGAAALYMVGRQEFMQLEYWTHTMPPQRPLPPDWRLNDIGLCRLGVSVSDFAGALAIVVDELRRVCFRDPTLDIPVEIMGEGDALPGSRDRCHCPDPAAVYVALSVTNLEDSLAHFGDLVGLQPVPGELYAPEHEASWGLAGACRQTAPLRGGTTFLEPVRYEFPADRPRPLDDGLNGRGFKTIAVGHRDLSDTGAIFRGVKATRLDRPRTGLVCLRQPRRGSSRPPHEDAVGPVRARRTVRLRTGARTLVVSPGRHAVRGGLRSLTT